MAEDERDRAGLLETNQGAVPLSIEGSAELTLEDYRKAWLLIPQFLRLAKLLVLLPFFGAFGLATWLLAGGSSHSAAQLLAYSLPTLILVGLCVFALKAAPRSWAKRCIADLGAGRASFRFDDVGLRCEYARHQVQVNWAGLPQHVETRDAFVVYTASQAVCVIPKRAFSEQQIAALSSLLRQRIPAKTPSGRIARLVGLWLVVTVVLLTLMHVLGRP